MLNDVDHSKFFFASFGLYFPLINDKIYRPRQFRDSGDDGEAVSSRTVHRQYESREISLVQVDTPPPPPHHYLPEPVPPGQVYHQYNQPRHAQNTSSPSSARMSSSSRLYTNVSLGIRALVLVLVTTAMILIMTAPGVCFWRTINGQQSSRDICPPHNSLFPMNIDRWHSGLHFQMRGQNVWGQLAIIILAFIFALPLLIFSCINLTSERNFIFSQIVVAGIALISFLVFGAFEVWYATGFDHMQTFIRQIGGGTFSGCAGLPGCEIGFIVKGWAVAAAFFFICAILYLIDAIICFLRNQKY